MMNVQQVRIKQVNFDGGEGIFGDRKACDFRSSKNRLFYFEILITVSEDRHLSDILKDKLKFLIDLVYKTFKAKK